MWRVVVGVILLLAAFVVVLGWYYEARSLAEWVLIAVVGVPLYLGLELLQARLTDGL